MTRRRWRTTTVVAGLWAVAALLLVRGSTRGAPDDSWRQLSLAAFVAEIERLTQAEEPLGDEVWTAIRAQAADRLLAPSSATADYGDLVSLYLWARPVLTAEQGAEVAARLHPPGNQVRAWSVARLREMHGRMRTARLPLEALHAVVLEWLGERDLRTVEDVDHLAWLFGRLQMMDRDAGAPRRLTARWTGHITVPQDGDYTLSVCPWNLNLRHGHRWRSQRIRIWLGESLVLDTGEEGWSYESEPVSLRAGIGRGVRIELACACSDASLWEHRPLAALLYWEGAGLPRALVPPEAWTRPDGSGNGLWGEYVLQWGEDEERISRVDEALQFIWYSGADVRARHESLRQSVRDQLYARMMAWDTLAAWEQTGAAGAASWVGAQWGWLESLTPGRQRDWAQRLLAHPVLLVDCDAGAAYRVYHYCRIGAADAALRLLGSWAQAHPDATPVLTVDFARDNRHISHALARIMHDEYPPHGEQWADRYLELPDGGCSLPVAYAVSYGHALRGEMSDWIDQLTARLEDDQLTGDQRVGWLLARAQAEEIRGGVTGPGTSPVERLLAGRGWLEEATLVAQSEAARLRAFLELAAREAAEERLEVAQRLLDQAAQRCTGEASRATLAQWRGDLQGLGQTLATRRLAREAQAQASYVDQLRARHRSALDQGDSAAAARYEERLAAAGIAP